MESGDLTSLGGPVLFPRALGNFMLAKQARTSDGLAPQEALSAEGAKALRATTTKRMPRRMTFSSKKSDLIRI
jgi:hypothetical protein